MPMERLHQGEHTEVNPATNALEGAYAHQNETSEQRRKSVGDILRRIPWGFGLSAAAVVVGDTIESTQSQSAGGWLKGLGTALFDGGLLGLAVTAATTVIVGYEIFKNHKKNKREKITVIH